jgi:hypothetical protein
LVVGGQSPFGHAEEGPGGIGRSYSFTFIDQEFIFLSFAEDAVEGVGASEEVEPGEVGQSVGAELDRSDLFLVLLLFLTPHNYLSGLLILVDQVPDESVLRGSEYFSHAGFHLAHESGYAFIVVNFKDEFLFDWIGIGVTFEEEVNCDGLSVVGVQVIPVYLALEQGFFWTIVLLEFHNKEGVSDSDEVQVVKIAATNKKLKLFLFISLAH